MAETKANETKATEKATVKVDETARFIERKLNILNAKNTAKAQKAMARIIANNKGGVQ